MICGLLGEKLGHSYSPQIHALLGNYCYQLFEKNKTELQDFLKSGEFSGLNVTIPYKKAVIPYCSELSDIARKLGAVNTIIRKPDGSLIGHNTDYFGFQSMVMKSGLQLCGKQALILGSGGASATVVTVLEELGASVTVISRSGDNNYENIYRFSDASVIVNATPVGMYPKNGQRLVDLKRFPKLEGVLDLIYNPARTQLIMDAEQLGLIAMNGLWMLVAQAKESSEWFTGQKIPDRQIQTIYKKLSGQMQNIILIGMPGCGKSTIGKYLASQLGRNFIDADEEIVKYAGMTIPEIFQTSGEETFRRIETQVLAEIGKQSGLVIATGGGCVTKEHNYSLLHQNGMVFWIKRDIAMLPTEGRPLSQSNKLTDLYEQRKDSYAYFADQVVTNDTTPEDAAEQIILMGDYL